ncbi:hypothetical protein [Hymenobacter radiodurans]|uniref:hypothetical protein n=1 Tax=Hymenobacter radiodurans TaxID=2496028 RepID=UPI001058BF33|nr:hypothetical protein [Hymenobacter radiodurans]
MEIFTKLRWVGCFWLASTGGLFSCDSGQKKEPSASQQPAVLSQTDTTREEETGLDPKLSKPPFEPGAGVIPSNETEYKAALAAIDEYERVNPKAVVTSNYFSRTTINKIMQDTENCAGIRIYRTYGNNKKDFGILITAVDSTGKEVKKSVQLKDGFKVDYLIGTSEERCPDNCGHFDQN